MDTAHGHLTSVSGDDGGIVVLKMEDEDFKTSTVEVRNAK
jgi:hypothetical protein